jgi:hypothetical protein
MIPLQLPAHEDLDPFGSQEHSQNLVQ